ncbi:hypothetical protein B0H13DRAFT_2316461 [Mycena leptocephala]|nr:hypothetical protein B0H13DRAFT_2316461 [Mycena leptocephala]
MKPACVVGVPKTSAAKKIARLRKVRLTPRTVFDLVICDVTVEAIFVTAPPTNIIKRLHISFTPSVPSSGPAELTKSLTTHFGKFGTVKSVDGLGDLDGVGMPRKFGFISIEGSEASITKCVNSLSGSTWKGVKVRVGYARPNFDQRIAQENAEEPAPPRRKRKRDGVHAEDMTVVTPETAAHRSGCSRDSKKETTKLKKRRDPDSRSRRRTIDMTRWGSVHLKGMFLEDAGQDTGHLSQDEVQEMVEADQSDQSSDSEPDGGVPVSTSDHRDTAVPEVNPAAIAAVAAPTVASKPPIPISNQTASEVISAQSDVDLAKEKSQSLSLLNSLFGARDGAWGGRESVGSDVDEEELLKIGGVMPLNDDDEIEEPDVGFSLLGHLDLDLELDEELAHAIPLGESEAPLLFPPPTSFSSAPGLSSTKARQRDILDVDKDDGWNAYFYRTKTDDEIRAKWEKEKVDLTREWNRRWREAALMATSAIS